jgi:hypothetical protein
MIKGALIAVGCLSLMFAVPASAGGGTITWYLSANNNISCQVSSGVAQGTLAYCQTIKPARSATLHRNGLIKFCTGAACLGDPADTAKVLRSGAKDAVVGPFTCYATGRATITCYVTKTGNGFAASPTGIKKITVRRAGTQ